MVARTHPSAWDWRRLQYQELGRRTAFDLKMLGRSLLDVRAGLASKLAAAAGLACMFIPFDLIPNRIPVVGYLARAAYAALGLIAAFLLLPRTYRDHYRASFARSIGVAALRSGHRAMESATAMPVWLSADGRHLRAAALRLAVLQAGAFVAGRPILRLVMGRWPRAAEVTAFRASFAHFAPVPPLLRALASVPAARHQLTRAMLASWMDADRPHKEGMKQELGSTAAAQGDSLEVWLGRPVAFLHLEKTAGMSVASFLTARFHPLQIDPDPNRGFPPHVLTPFPPHIVGKVRRYPLVWGHYDLPSIRRIGGDRFVFTFLREPKARILSLYWYWRSHGPLHLGRDGFDQPALAALSLPLAEFLRCDDPCIRDHIDNFYVRRLTGRYLTGGAGDTLMTDAEGSLKAALDALASLDFVGITEDMDDSMAALGGLLDFDPPAKAPRVNVTRRRDGWTTPDGEGPYDPISPRVAAELAKLTRMDEPVYAAACQRLEGVLARNWPSWNTSRAG